MLSTGLLIVTRFNSAERYGAYFAGAQPVCGLTHDEVMRRYRGVEGNPWGGRDVRSIYPFLLETGLADLSEYESVRDAFTRDFGPGSDLIYIGGVGVPAELPDAFVFAGYDYGDYESIWGNLSVVLNDVIYGHLPQMRVFGASLNQNLLLPSMEDAEQLGAVRASLLEQGADLEDGSEEWCTIQVWLHTGR